MKPAPSSTTVLCALLAVMWTARARAGTVELHDIRSVAVAGNQMGITSTRRVLVYLPDGYATTRRSYPVLYWIPGWETPASREYVGALDAAISSGSMCPAIVVSVDVREGIVLMDSSVFGRWESFMTDEVVPLVDSEYRTVPRANGRAIMGHSTGGYGAALLAARRPDIWGAAGLNDASMWAGCSLPREELPDSFDSYEEVSGYLRAWMQVAIAIAPEPAEPLRFRTPHANVAAEITDRDWQPYCLYGAAAMRLYGEALRAMATVEIIVAQDRSAITNSWSNRLMWTAMKRAGVRAHLTEMYGTHGGDRSNRFVFLARRIVAKLDRAYPDVRARTMSWGGIRQRLREGPP